MKIEWKEYNGWSGCKIKGAKKYLLNSDDRKQHMKKALWLTSQVETGGVFGTINSYDGTGMSAGLEHKIAIYPKTMEQASLWPFLKEIENNAHCLEMEVLWEAFWCDANWYLEKDGILRSRYNKNIIPGQEIRDKLTPPDGKVPNHGKDWERAKYWAGMFYNLFSSKQTEQIQIKSAIKSLVSGNSRFEEEVYKIITKNKDAENVEVGIDIGYEHDLAFCVYHSFSVNAPTLARKQLVRAEPYGDRKFPKRVIKFLGTTNYGRWHDQADGYNRYDRTRYFAKQSGLWPEELFVGKNAIMPENL